LPVTEPISVFGRLPLSAPDLVADTKEELKEALEKLLRESDLDGVRVDVHLARGEACELIPHLAQEKQIDLIVMGTVCRTGVPGVLIGNTAERVLRKLSCSLLTVKPEGSVSPVTCEPSPTEGRDPLPSEAEMAQTIAAVGDQQRERF
jgi:nucleotide-binding universal stress UspA family protein